MSTPAPNKSKLSGGSRGGSRGSSSASSADATVGSAIEAPLYETSAHKNEDTGIEFSVVSPARSTRIEKKIRLINDKDRSAVRAFELHKHEGMVLQLIDEYKQNPNKISDPDHKYFRTHRLFANLPTENKYSFDENTKTIIIDQTRFNGISLLKFLRNNNLPPIGISMLLLLICLEIYKLSLLGINHNDMHPGNIYVVNTMAYDYVINSDWQRATLDITNKIISAYKDLNKPPSNYGKFMATVDKIMRKLPFRVKIFDFDRAAIHNAFDMNNPRDVARMNQYRSAFGILHRFELYDLSLLKILTSNDLHQSTVMFYKYIYNTRQFNSIDHHGGLQYIEHVVNKNNSCWSSPDVYGQKFQLLTHDHELNPTECVMNEVETLKSAFDASVDIPDVLWPFFVSRNLVPIPSKADLIESEIKTPNAAKPATKSAKSAARRTAIPDPTHSKRHKPQNDKDGDGGDVGGYLA